jgi:hypothetical protein
MRVKEVTALEHYERLVAENNDPARDSEQPREYMSRWDGPKFYQCLGSCKAKRILPMW